MTVTIVAGPPCSGKTHHVKQHAQPADLVLDWDDIAIELGSPRTHLHPKPMLPMIAAEYDRRLEQLVPTWPADVWIVRGLPDPAERRAWVDRFSAQLVLCSAPLNVLHLRALERENPRLTAWSIDRWHERSNASSALGVFG